MSKGKTVTGRLALAFAALLTVLAVSGPTLADDDWRRWGHDNDHYWGDNDGRRHDNDGWRHRDGGWGNHWDNGWGNNWRHHDNWGHRKRYDYPRFVYVQPRPYYARPYYYDYYSRPSFNFVIPLHID